MIEETFKSWGVIESKSSGLVDKVLDDIDGTMRSWDTIESPSSALVDEKIASSQSSKEIQRASKMKKKLPRSMLDKESTLIVDDRGRIHSQRSLPKPPQSSKGIQRASTMRKKLPWSLFDKEGSLVVEDSGRIHSQKSLPRPPQISKGIQRAFTMKKKLPWSMFDKESSRRSNLSTNSILSAKDLRDHTKAKEFVDKSYRTQLVRPVGYSSKQATWLDGKKPNWTIGVSRAAMGKDQL